MNSWNILSNNNNKTGKLTIPILNSTSPHNYVIMPALLAHIDSPVSSKCFSSSRTQRQSTHNNSESHTGNSMFDTKTRRNSNRKSSNSINSNSNNNDKNSVISFKSSKEIIYTTKRLKPMSSDEERDTQSRHMNASSLISTMNNDNLFSRNESNYFDCSSYSVKIHL